MMTLRNRTLFASIASENAFVNSGETPMPEVAAIDSGYVVVVPRRRNLDA